MLAFTWSKFKVIWSSFVSQIKLQIGLPQVNYQFEFEPSG